MTLLGLLFIKTHLPLLIVIQTFGKPPTLLSFLIEPSPFLFYHSDYVAMELMDPDSRTGKSIRPKKSGLD